MGSHWTNLDYRSLASLEELNVVLCNKTPTGVVHAIDVSGSVVTKENPIAM